MSANDYIAELKQNPKNAKLFKAKEMKLKVESFESQIRLAFEAGRKSGVGSKSLYEQIFGSKVSI